MTQGVPPDDLLKYFRDAGSWEQDRARAAVRLQRVAWGVAAGACLLAIGAVIALMSLAPLKSVSAYVVRVNETTGAVDVLSELKDHQAIGADEAITKNNLARYVQARQGWIPAAASENFKLVAVMSDPAEQQRWAKYFSVKNPESPQVVWGPDSSAQVSILNISFINHHVATVRYRLNLTKYGKTQVSDWIATVGFGYSSAPVQEAVRFINPLGFQVQSFRADPEVNQ